MWFLFTYEISMSTFHLIFSTGAFKSQINRMLFFEISSLAAEERPTNHWNTCLNSQLTNLLEVFYFYADMV
jgi:hypothetical protein